ncbi:formate-dependent phosphoribosylglycinamide formyltransferase [Corynebacterium felinum]|uniref:Formate-dependent phosphoribosylglycinamide formyltransferase n=1 Tax=Corynebacterium felinum TaxID=131318 RepID=A0ABU2B802_9CORY|nr:formate-dependent phosphoribosylglycinamide formyltransferase [Corynebacterium felinum]MDF5820156.1 formate-dependent phosphoribosylglycinamide formyltransferase [Corynebacterium felinum]MDR7353908.1 phosphoribosylglycinamide formyltransferase 2 [Corynebacterium felinum]WJY96081.1 Phosphoribosylglycinamide formyltransferase 2 [Corynebacterium felinum]
MYTPDTIGTPLAADSTRVMIFGSGELGKEVVIAFQRLGVEVHAVDRYEHAPAQQVAHFSYTIDMTDAEAVRELVAYVRPDYIVPEIEALATDILGEIEQAGVTVIPTARATQLTMDREGIRRLANEQLGLPTSAYRFASNFDQYVEAIAALGFPCVVKPLMSSSGKGQSVLRGPDDVAAAWDYAQTGGHTVQAPGAGSKKVIVERYVTFDYEITLLTVRSIDPVTGEDATWFCEPIGHKQHEGDYVESWQPARMSQVALENARSVAARITNALGGRGVFGVELFVAGDDVYFSEVSPRPHDTGMVTMASQRFSEFELHARAILGLPIDVTLTSPGASAVIYGGCESAAVRFGGLSQALAVPETDVRLFGKPNAHMRRRMGVALSTAPDVAQARERARSAAAAITVHACKEH